MASASSERAGGAPTDTPPEISRILWRTDHWMHCYHNYSALVSLLTTNLSFAAFLPLFPLLSFFFRTFFFTLSSHTTCFPSSSCFGCSVVKQIAEILDPTEYDSFAAVAGTILHKCDRALPLIAMLVKNELKNATAAGKCSVFRGNNFVSALEKAFVSLCTHPTRLWHCSPHHIFLPSNRAHGKGVSCECSWRPHPTDSGRQGP